jgi:hypothetical protein
MSKKHPTIISKAPTSQQIQAAAQQQARQAERIATAAVRATDQIVHDTEGVDMGIQGIMDIELTMQQEEARMAKEILIAGREAERAVAAAGGQTLPSILIEEE